MTSDTGGGSTDFSTKESDLLSCARTLGGHFMLDPSSAPSTKVGKLRPFTWSK